MRHLLPGILLGILMFFAVIIGTLLGIALAATKNIDMSEAFKTQAPALPTQILDIKGRLITELFSTEKREIVSIDEIPRALIDAVLTREDRHFYEHHGFRIVDVIKAAWHIVTGQFFQGGSTITQQLAGTLYADRSEISLKRKLVELWWALQLERRYSKNEILEMYLNQMYFGHNTYGVEAASQFYFKHSVREITPAEAAMLVIQLASPGYYSPINHPNRARKRQREILDQMVELGYLTKEEADLSFEQFWENYDYTRTNISTAFIDREDRAPYFSEYVRQKLEDMLFGSMDIYKAGLVVHTTLDLDYQQIAEKVMRQGIKRVNARYQLETSNRLRYADETFLNIIDLLSLGFNIDDLRVAGRRQQRLAKNMYLSDLNPVVDIVADLFNMNELRYTTKVAYKIKEKESQKTEVEGALISIDSRKGYIYAMVGGKKFESTNQFNRATQSKVQPGSSFKPLYYSAAITSRKFTPATMIIDAPVVFWNDDGTEYTPLNYKGEWKGRVLLWYALAHSMNVPSLKVLDGIGFDTAIKRASRMLGITDPKEIEKTFPRKYPLGLGVITVSPLQMARAFATFPNEGIEVDPIAIRYVEDRNGKIILEPEKQLRLQQKKKGKDLRIMSPQVAYIMTDLLERVVKTGTLRWAASTVGGFDRPIAGKTGTTQNWSDAWTVGFTPQITTALWFGFDERGHSLGVNLSGAVSAGPVWAKYMKEVHKNLPVLDFKKPDSGIREVTVCSLSGKLPTEYCKDTIKLPFLSGTEPKEFCTLCEYEAKKKETIENNIRNSLLPGELPLDTFNLPDSTFDLSNPEGGGQTKEKGETSTGNPLLD